MRYYEYLGVVPENYQNKAHLSTSNNCIFNVGIWLEDEGHEVDGLLQVSLDGIIWANYSPFSFTVGGALLFRFIPNFKGIRIFPEDGGDLVNFCVSEFYQPVKLIGIGGGVV